MFEAKSDGRIVEINHGSLSLMSLYAVKQGSLNSFKDRLAPNGFKFGQVKFIEDVEDLLFVQPKPLLYFAVENDGELTKIGAVGFDKDRLRKDLSDIADSLDLDIVTPKFGENKFFICRNAVKNYSTARINAAISKTKLEDEYSALMYEQFLICALDFKDKEAKDYARKEYNLPKLDEGFSLN